MENMEGILGVLFIIFLFVGVPALFILVPALVHYLFTGETPKQMAYRKEVEKHQHAMRVGRLHAQINRDARDRLLDEDDD